MNFKKIILLLFLFSLNIFAIDLTEHNSTNYNASDLDIIGAYKVLCGKPISLESFKNIKQLKDFNNWSLKDLGLYLVTLEESNTFLNHKDWWKIKSQKYDNSETSNSKQLNQYESFLSKTNTTCLTDIDIAAGYRVILGKPISQAEFLNCKKLVEAYNWDFKQLAIHLLTFDEAHHNLEIPNLDNIEVFPIKMKNGATIFGYKSDYAIANCIKKYGYWEPHLEKLVRKILKQGDVVLDIGANIGAHTSTFCLIVGVTGKVLAFEPIPAFAVLLNKMRKFNNFIQLKIFPFALSNAQGNLFLKVNSINPGASHIVEASQDGLPRVIKVSTNKLDDIILKEKLTRLDYIKMDVEGAEPLVIQGARKTIKKFLPKITWEFSLDSYKNRGIDPLKLLNEFKLLGYKIAIITDIMNEKNPLSLNHGKWLEPQELIAKFEQLNVAQIDIFLTLLRSNPSTSSG